jgi:flavodoxin I
MCEPLYKTLASKRRGIYMKVLIIYDSAYGNTEKIARAIGDALGSENDIEVIKVNNANPDQVTGLQLFIVGSPTYAGRPTPPILDYLNKVPETAINGINVAAFDTRVSAKFARIFGYASDKIAATLKKKGGNLVANPEGFIVNGKEGPLQEGELEHAKTWGEGIRNKK